MNILTKKFILQIFIAFTWIILSLYKLSGQTPYESLTTADGLSQGMVFDMIQDKEGFIWMATKDGLNRYDGYEFKVFSNDPYNNQSLNNNSIIRLFEDSKGRIWAGTENSGVNIYDKLKGIFYRLEHNPANANSISGNNIRAMEELPDGRLLIATVGNGLNIIAISDDFFSKNTTPVVTKFNMPENIEVFGLGKSKNNKIYIGGMDGSVYDFDYQKMRFTRLSRGRLYHSGFLAEDGSIMINNHLFLDDGKTIIPLFDTTKKPEGNIIFRPNSALWEFHHRELHFYDISRWEKGNQPEWSEKLPVDKKTRIIYPFIIDKSGMLWTGTVGYGLRKYNINEKDFITLAKGQSIRLIKPVSSNEIYCVNYGHNWMKFIHDNICDNNLFKTIPQVTEIDNIILSTTGDFYIKSDNKGYFNYNPETKKLTHLPLINPNQTFGRKQPFIEDRHGSIWFPASDGKFTLLNTHTGKADSLTINSRGTKLLCTALLEDKDDTFWIGTETGFAKVKIYRKNISLPEITWYFNTPNNRNSLSYDHVTCFLDDPSEPEKYLWIATKGGGINRFNKITGDFFQLSFKDGLPDNVVYGLLQDESGHIWGSTNKGIFSMEIIHNSTKPEYSFRNFTKKDGLQDDEFNTGAFAKLPDGRLAFGGVNGLNIFDPKKVMKPGFVPNVFITKILVGNKPVFPNDKTGILNESIDQAKSITLTHLQDILTLEFASLDFSNPSQNKYRYQLTGIDHEWVQSETRRSATYLHLPAGKYTFKVQGSNSIGIWSDKIAALDILVLPPWWATWWAYFTYFMMLVIAARTYILYRINKTKIASQLVLEQNEAKRVKELDTVKSRLYTNITHEFRTPLTVILGMVQQIKSAPDEHLTNGLVMIERNGKNLLNLVNEMLDLSKLEAGKMVLHPVQGDIIQFLRYIVESFHSMAESQDKHMHYLSSLDSLYGEYDAEKLRQIISNLLSNALKFTPVKGNIYITIDTKSQDNAGEDGWLVIKIKDTGNGIPEDQLPFIFERFYQADNSHTRSAEGTGIGLALTKELVQLMHGKISVKSPPVGARRGTEFTLELPLPEEKSIAGMASVSEPEYPQLSLNKEHDIPIVTENKSSERHGQYLVLLVEDNADVVAYTAGCLPEYRLVVGKDGQEGFDIATELIPDLIITDVMMPNVDGFEMCKQLRSDERTSHIPIIMLTAKADMESKLEGYGHGADAYLEKPFYKDELKLRIKTLLEQRKLLQKIYSKVAGLNHHADENNANEEDLVDMLPNVIQIIENEFVKKVRLDIVLHLHDETFSVEQLSKNLFMSHSQLHRKLSALTGYTPNQFIRILRIQKAKELLKSTNDSITNIASVCGFNDASYFGKVFRQECSMTPQEYRNSK